MKTKTRVVQNLILFIMGEKGAYHEIVMEQEDKNILLALITRFNNGKIGCVEKPSKIVLGKRKA